MKTVKRVGAGGADAWRREWTATADYVAAIGDERASKGHGVSAREAYFWASTYRISYYPLFEAP